MIKIFQQVRDIRTSRTLRSALSHPWLSSCHPSCNLQIHISGIEGRFFQGIREYSGSLAALRGHTGQGWLRCLCTLGLPSISTELPSYITTDPNCRSPLQIGALFASRCCDVKNTCGQIPGECRVYKCSSGYSITDIHHAISCSLRSFASIVTHLITYTPYKYINQPTNPPTIRGTT